jgi:hypothetical protein
VMDSHVGSGKVITAPLVTEDGRPIKDPLVLLEATEQSTSAGVSTSNKIEIDADASPITDKQVIEWKLTLHQIGMLQPLFLFFYLNSLSLFNERL